MAKRLGLPLADDRTPTVDAVRRRLGGRAASDAGAGDLVAFAAPRGGDRLGVVLFARGDDLDVWIDDGLVRRMARGETRGADVSPPRELAEIADAVRAFAALAEGQRVRFHEQARVAEGRLVEKCRFGALVERDDGTLVGIGFRRVAATASAGAVSAAGN